MYVFMYVCMYMQMITFPHKLYTWRTVLFIEIFVYVSDFDVTTCIHLKILMYMQGILMLQLVYVSGLVCMVVKWVHTRSNKLASTNFSPLHS